MIAFLREVLDTSSALGLAWWQRLALTLAVAILYVLGKDATRYAARALERVHLEGDPTSSGTGDAASAPAAAEWGATSSDPAADGRPPG